MSCNFILAKHAQAKADNAELERRAETVKLKAKLHALHQRNAHLQSQAAARPDLAPGERGKPRESSITIKEPRADPALTAKASSEIERLGYPRVTLKTRATPPSRRKLEVRNYSRARLLSS